MGICGIMGRRLAMGIRLATGCRLAIDRQLAMGIRLATGRWLTIGRRLAMGIRLAIFLPDRIQWRQSKGSPTADNRQKGWKRADSTIESGHSASGTI
jgi:hypothetical protein